MLYLSSAVFIGKQTLQIIIIYYTQPVLLTCDSNGRHRDVVGIAETGSGKLFTFLLHIAIFETCIMFKLYLFIYIYGYHTFLKVC